MTVSIDERRAALEACHPCWEPRTLASHFARVAAEYPDRPAVIARGESWSWHELRERSRALARGLVALGVEPGEHVATIMANHPELIALKLAIAEAGAVAVPLNFLLHAQELRYVIGQSDSVLLVTMERFRDLDYAAALDELAPGWARNGGGSAFPKLRRVVAFEPDGDVRSGAMTLDDLIAAGESVTDDEVDTRAGAAQPDHVADVVYTSGTTGFPKGAMLTHENVLRCAYGSAFARAFEDGRRIIFALPLYHVFAYVEGLLAASFVGGAVVPQLTFDPVATLDAIERHQVNEALFVPTMTVAVVEHPRRDEFDLSSLRAIMSAAAPAPVWLWRRVRDELGVPEITTAYGQTEASASTTVTFPGDPLELVSGTVGRAKPGGAAGDPELGGLVAEYRVVDPESGVERPPGAEGELAVRGPLIMRGYYGKPEETAAALDAGGWLRSGDLGRIRDDGYVELTGRSKELYKCGGELVAPKEVEELFTGRDDVEQAYVVGIPDERMGEVGCAFVVAARGRRPDPDELAADCAARLARFKVPRHVLFIEAGELPVTPTGKVQKFRLVELARERLAAPAAAGSRIVAAPPAG